MSTIFPPLPLYSCSLLCSWFSLISFSICCWLFWSWHQRFFINSSLSVFSIVFPLSFSLCCWSNCHDLGRIKEDEGGMTESARNFTVVFGSVAKGWNEKWVMGQFLVGSNIARALLCFNEPGSEDYIHSNRLELRLQNVLPIHLMAFCWVWLMVFQPFCCPGLYQWHLSRTIKVQCRI